MDADIRADAVSDIHPFSYLDPDTDPDPYSTPTPASDRRIGGDHDNTRDLDHISDTYRRAEVSDFY